MAQKSTVAPYTHGECMASNNNLALGRVKVSEKSNEITAIPELIANLAIQGSIITGDASRICSKAIFRNSQVAPKTNG